MSARPGISLASFLVAAAGTILLAADQGGFFPRTWPWAALAFSAVAALAMLSTGELSVRRAALVLVGGLAALSAWTACSVLWSTEPQTSLQEVVRTPVYVAAALALTVLAAAGGSLGLLVGLVVGTTGTAAYSLGDRLLHGPHLGDQQAGLLDRPLGYANALGALCAIALVVVLALACSLRSRATAVAVAVSTAILGTALALTESRGAWIAGAVGLAVAAAARRGRRWATAAAAAGGLTLLAVSVLSAFQIPARLQSRGDYWHVAWHVAAGHPLLGTGAGTYDLAWAAFGDVVRWNGTLDAHSLYLETLAELGVIGFVLLAALVVPIGSALMVDRRSARLAASLGGATTFLLHAGLDWDWEMPAVTVAGITCLAVALGADDASLAVGSRLRGGALTLALMTAAAYLALLVARAV